MAKPPTKLSESYANAEAAVTASAKAVAQASRKQLSAILALPPQERFDHLQDPSLTPEDARALTQSLRVVTKPKVHRPIWFKLTHWPRRLSFRFLISPAIIALMVMTAAYAVFVWSRTPQKVTVTQTVAAALLYPDGVRRITYLNPGTGFFLVRSDRNEAVIRPRLPTVAQQEIVVPSSIVEPAN
jgi:hypothetical protein